MTHFPSSVNDFDIAPSNCATQDKCCVKRAHNRRVLTGPERQKAYEMRAAGASYKTISQALQCNWEKIREVVGPAARRTPARTTRGLRKQAQKARVSRGQGNDLRPAEHGYALPAGSPESWGAISSEPYPGRTP